MSFQIPKHFQLGGQTFTVKKVKGEINHESSGRCNMDQDIVEVSEKSRYGDISPDAQGRIFCHELMHLIFDFAGEREASENEQMVERLASLLFQFLQTQRTR